MKKVVIKTVRVISWICIVLNIIGTAALFYAANSYNLLGIIMQKWQENPLNFGDSDVMTINRSILFLVVPILLLTFVRDKKQTNKN